MSMLLEVVVVVIIVVVMVVLMFVLLFVGVVVINYPQHKSKSQTIIPHQNNAI